MNVSQAFDFVQSELASEACSKISPETSSEISPEVSSGINKDEILVDARYLLSFILQKSFTWLKTWPDKELNQSQLQQLERLVVRRKSGEPIAYITGEKEFWTLRLKTNPSTLIPRPETELLVEMALDFLAQYSNSKILDLGTGTGAIALAIAIERPDDQLFACDSQLSAVELARQNAELNEISNVKIIQSDWFSQIDKQLFQLIVSNPPYVEMNDPHLLEGDLVFEPGSALVSGEEGLADIKKIVLQSKGYLDNGGGLMIEHGYLQGEAIRKLFAENEYQDIETYCDLAGLERVTFGKRLSETLD